MLAAPAHAGSGPLAGPALDDATRADSAPLENPATGAARLASPLAVTEPLRAHPQPAGAAAQPSASPAAGGSATPGPQQSPSSSQSGSAQQAAPQHPYDFYDSVDPQSIPAGAIVATYSTGAHPIPASAVTGRKQVMWIDTLATDPSASALDIEPGCATPSQVPGWVSSRLKSHPGQVAILYMSLSEWPQIQAEVASLPSSMKSRIRWWVADPTGVPHIVPGSQATQWYWGSSYDESMAEPNFDPHLVPGPGA